MDSQPGSGARRVASALSAVPRLPRLSRLLPGGRKRNVSQGTRYFHAGLYTLCGVLSLGAQIGSGFSVTSTLAALVLIAYGGYIGLTKRPYWVSVWMYIIPVIVVLAVFIAS